MTAEVRLMHYDPRWPQEFEQTRSSILQSCEGWVVDVTHVGSTAISGLVARPIIDVVATVADLAGWEIATTCLEGLNYRVDIREDVGDAPAWMRGGRRLIKPRHGDGTHHVYLFPGDSPAMQAIIRFRDLLASDRNRALAYEEEKVSRWRSAGGDAVVYEHWKQSYFDDLA